MSEIDRDFEVEDAERKANGATILERLEAVLGPNLDAQDAVIPESLLQDMDDFYVDDPGPL